MICLPLGLPPHSFNRLRRRSQKLSDGGGLINWSMFEGDLIFGYVHLIPVDETSRLLNLVLALHPKLGPYTTDQPRATSLLRRGRPSNHKTSRIVWIVSG